MTAARFFALGFLGLALSVLPARAAPLPPPPPGYHPDDMTSEEAGLWMQVDKEEASLKVAPNRITDPALNTYVRGVLCKLAKDYCDSIRLYILEVPEFNAFAMPNGAVAVNTGLLLRAENEAQLAFVLGHELTHFLHRHTLEHMKKVVNTAGLLVFVDLAAVGAGAPGLASLANNIGVWSLFAHSRDEERDADATGFQLAVASGYDPSQAAANWRYMIAEDGVHEHRSRNMFLADHPASEERLENLEKAAASVPPGPEAWLVERDAYRKAMAPFLKQLVADELARGEAKESVVLFSRLATQQPEEGLFRYGLGEAYRRRNTKDDAPLALAAYRAALDCADAPVEAWRGLGLVAMKSGDKDEARKAFTEYRTRAPDADDKAMIEFYLNQQ